MRREDKRQSLIKSRLVRYEKGRKEKNVHQVVTRKYKKRRREKMFIKL